MQRQKAFLNDFHRSTLITVVFAHILFLVFIFNTSQSNKTSQKKKFISFLALIKSDENKPNILNKNEVKKNISQSYDLKINVNKNPVVDQVNKNDSITERNSIVDIEKNDFDSLIKKDSNPAYASSQKYNLTLPKLEAEEEKKLNPAQQAAQDVRSNSPKLTKSEKFSIAAGTFDCIYQTRLADGSVIRVPGIWEVVPAHTVDGRKTLATARFCIRLNRKDESGNSDMKSINEGLRGKF